IDYLIKGVSGEFGRSRFIREFNAASSGGPISRESQPFDEVNSMAISTGGPEGGVASTPNVTPMVDVMLVLLIIFMVVTPALLAGFQADPPQAQNIKDHPEDEQNDQVLGIDKDGHYYLNKKQIR